MTEEKKGIIEEIGWGGIGFVGFFVVLILVGSYFVTQSNYLVPPPSPTATITVVDRIWDGNSGHFGYVTTSWGDVYRVQNPEDYMRMQLNHTYNVNIDNVTWKFIVITKMNYEVLP